MDEIQTFERKHMPAEVLSRLAAALVRLAGGFWRSMTAFSAVVGCLPSIASQWGSVPTSTGHLGKGCARICEWASTNDFHGELGSVKAVHYHLIRTCIGREFNRVRAV